MGSHIVSGKFKSDKYEWCPPGFFPVKLTDGDAQDLLWEYAERHIEKDAELSGDLKAGLRLVGYDPEKKPAIEWEMALQSAQRALTTAHLAIDDIAGWSGSSGNWPLQDASSIVNTALDLFKEKGRKYALIAVYMTPGMKECLELFIDYYLSRPAKDEAIEGAKKTFIDAIKYALTKV
jgi:hypothetical protein